MRLRQRLVPLAWCLLAGLTLAQTGCLFLVAGAAAGGAAATYVYLHGVLYRDYAANLADGVAAVRTSLMELRLPLVDENPGTGEVILHSRTLDGSKIRIRVESIPGRIPVETPVTRIGVRVGFAGDEVVSARILDQISTHLLAPGTAGPIQANRLAPVAPAPVTPPPPVETPPPPLLEPQPPAQ